MSVYKCCAVPQCTNTTIKTPSKLFISVPMNINIRKKWLQLARRNADDISQKSRPYFCEDHFDIKKDMKNYYQYQMGFCKKIILNDGVLPSKFHWQPQSDHRKRTCDAETSRSEFTKRHRSALIEQCERSLLQPSQPVDVPLIANVENTIAEPHLIMCDKYTSDMEIKKRIGFDEERSDSDVSINNARQETSSSYAVTSSKLSKSSSHMTDTKEDILKLQSLQFNLKLIVEKPKMYIGIPKECYFMVNLIHKHTNIPHEHILLCLRKIKLNSTFSELEDNFGLSLSYASKLFLKNIPLIASVMRQFIVKLDKLYFTKTLPVQHNKYKVSCIIDCLEIDIQKPTKALFQALAWSDYKKGITTKYLISCTPNGLVNYISSGFGGRASDRTIMENCDFLDGLEPGTLILADRGFKHVEQILNEKEIKLLRPPSATSGSKLSKAQERQSNIIASLRIHIERVKRRLREFHMLRQHSVVNKNFLRIFDDVMVIACALVNIQDAQ